MRLGDAARCSAANTTYGCVRGTRCSQALLSFNGALVFIWLRKEPTMIAAPIDGPLVEFFQMVRTNDRRRGRTAVGGVSGTRSPYCEPLPAPSAFKQCIFCRSASRWYGMGARCGPHWVRSGAAGAVQCPSSGNIPRLRRRHWILAAVSHALHSTGGLQVWTGCIPLNPRLAGSACSRRSESFPKRFVPDVRRHHRDG